MKNLRIMYRCNVCGVGKVEGSGMPSAECLVPAREEGQDILQWMDMVGIWVRDNHRAKSPECKSTLVDMAIPVKENDESAHIGGPV